MTGTNDGFKIAEVDLELRGPGDFFGTRQSGLPEFRVADLLRDGAMLEEARREAFALIQADPQLSAPQAGLMASLAQGIVGGEMAWPLVGVGVLMGVAMIMLQVRSPMLVAVGMYLPLDTTFAIFIGGMIRWLTDSLARRRQLNDAQRVRVENVGVLIASGLIAGEALVGLVVAAYAFFKEEALPGIFEHPSYLFGLGVLGLIAAVLVFVPLRNAGDPNEPAPPAAMM